MHFNFIKYKTDISNKKTNCFRNIITKYIKADTQEIKLIDVGANRGAFYNDLTLVFKSARMNVLLIEPIPDCYNELKDRFSNNKNVIILKEAVSNIIETRDFFINQFDETSSLLKIKNNIRELEGVDTKQNQVLNVTTNTLDNIVSEQKIKWGKIDLLKIDVQGFEDKVLLGGTETLKKTDFIWIEVSFKPLYNETCLFNDIYTLLSEINFILFEISDGHRSPQNELLQANCLFRNNNFI
jgi:FkbM family methyltransferase